MDFCHICPTPELDLVSKYDTHLVLAHLLEEDPAYRKFYQDLGAHHDVTLIMDNSAFEMFKRGEPMYPTDKLIDLATPIKADYVVMSDYPGEPGSKTIKAAEKMIPELKKNKLGTFFCPQSQTGDIEDLMAGYAWGFSHPDIDYIAVSILNVPIAFGVESGNKLQRFTARWKWMQMMKDRGFFACYAVQQEMKQYWQLSGKDVPPKKIHFLGMVDGPNEVELVREYHDIITTWDSSAAIWAGMNSIKFDSSPTGLIDGKFEKEVNFNTCIDEGSGRENAIYNMNFIDEMVGQSLWSNKNV